MFHITADIEELRPLVQQIVAEVLREMTPFNAGGKISFTEQEAADLLSFTRTQLRDERLRGRISHCRVVGRRVRYTLQQLQDYLAEREQNAAA